MTSCRESWEGGEARGVLCLKFDSTISSNFTYSLNVSHSISIIGSPTTYLNSAWLRIDPQRNNFSMILREHFVITWATLVISLDSVIIVRRPSNNVLLSCIQRFPSIFLTWKCSLVFKLEADNSTVPWSLQISVGDTIDAVATSLSNHLDVSLHKSLLTVRSFKMYDDSNVILVRESTSGLCSEVENRISSVT